MVRHSRSRAPITAAVLFALVLYTCYATAEVAGEAPLSRVVSDSDINAPIAHKEEDTPDTLSDTVAADPTAGPDRDGSLAELQSETSASTGLSSDSRQEADFAQSALPRLSASLLSSSLEKLSRSKDQDEIRHQIELQDKDWEGLQQEENPVVALEVDSSAAASPVTPVRPVHMRLMTRPKFFVSEHKKQAKQPRFAQMLAAADSEFRTENKSKSKSKNKSKSKQKSKSKSKKANNKNQHKKKATVTKSAPKPSHKVNKKRANHHAPAARHSPSRPRNHHDDDDTSAPVAQQAEDIKARFVAKLTEAMKPMQTATEMDQLGQEADLIQNLYELRDQAKLAEETGEGALAEQSEDDARTSAFRFMERATANAEAEADASTKASTRAMMRQRMFGGGTMFSTRAKDRRAGAEVASQVEGAAAKAKPSEIEDCTGCKLVWMQVEMDVGNARFVEDVQASFEHNCMDAQKSSIFYGVCEDMYDDMYAMTDDYMSSKFTVPQICSRAKMCK